jgi:hypothetical protein
VTSTDTGGYVAPVFVSNGTTAGFADFAQGTTSAAVAPCNTATSICEQAPTAVTSYTLTKPGAAPANNFSAKTTTTAGVESYNKMEQMSMVTSQYTNATTTFSNVTGLSFAIDASTNYAISCKLIYQGSATTTGMKIQFTGPASPTKVTAQTFQTTTTGAAGVFYSAAVDGTTFAVTLAGPAAIVTTGADLSSTLDVGVENGTTAGTWQLQAAANGVGTLTIQVGSFCKMQ